MFSVAGCIFCASVLQLEIKFFWGSSSFCHFLLCEFLQAATTHGACARSQLNVDYMHGNYTFEQNNSSTLARCSFWNIHSLGRSNEPVNVWYIWENISSLWNVETIAPELLFAARLKYLFVAVAFSVWQKRPAASTTAGMATIRAFQNGSRWSCQKRKQQKICLVTELHRRAGNPPEAPTEPLPCYPSLFMSFFHSFFIIMAPWISFLHRLQSIHSFTLKEITLNDPNSPAIRTKPWHKGQWPLG